MAPGDQSDNAETLAPDLRELDRQFQAINQDTHKLLDNLTEAEFNWHPKPGKWSMAQCFDHLIVTGHLSLTNIQAAIIEARSRGLFGPGPFHYGLLEKWFVRFMEPPPILKFKAPKVYAPPPDRALAEIRPAFFSMQDELLDWLRQADGIDLARVKVRNPVTNFLKLSLGQEFAFTVAHERRHLWQAQQIKAATAFRQADREVGAANDR